MSGSVTKRRSGQAVAPSTFAASVTSVEIPSSAAWKRGETPSEGRSVRGTGARSPGRTRSRSPQPTDSSGTFDSLNGRTVFPTLSLRAVTA